MRYSFEGYVLDSYRRTLSRDGVQISLGERAFSVLLTVPI
jgi:DNA-binding winged helix-turn-helix (wHTH) protein